MGMPTLSSTIFASIIAVVLLHQATRTYKIVVNYNAVKTLGLPIVVAPITWQDPLWMIIGGSFAWLQFLPFCSWVEVSYMGWSAPNKGQVHQKYGPVFILVSPNRTEFFMSDPMAAAELANKWKIWTKDPNLYSIFDVFGNNVNSTNGEDWQRHRKITGGAFRESNYKLVWDEGRRQAKQLLAAASKRSKSSMADIRSDMSLLAMHVLSGAAFGKSYDYGQGLKQVEAGHKLSYFAAIAFVLPNLALTMVLGSFHVPSWLLPNHLRKLRLAIAEYKHYLSETVTEQRTKGVSGDRHDLASQLLHANEIAKDEHSQSGGRAAYLTDNELFGNMFMFNLAGYETTAMSLSFTIPYITLKPELQDWIREEIGWVKEEGKLGSYEDAFPELKRCLALMYETLRLHSAVAHLPRLSPDIPTELHLPSINKTFVVPPGSFVSIPVTVMHHDKKIWGADVADYNPKRWIETNEKGEERLINEAEKEGYMPWIVGPRVCPGKKFSQVEFVAVLSTILSSYDLRPATLGKSKSDKDAWEALHRAVEDVYFVLTPMMKNAERCGVEFVPR